VASPPEGEVLAARATTYWDIATSLTGLPRPQFAALRVPASRRCTPALVSAA
jgi:hypothetical protein